MGRIGINEADYRELIEAVGNVLDWVSDRYPKYAGGELDPRQEFPWLKQLGDAYDKIEYTSEGKV